MNCSTFRSQLDAFADGELDARGGVDAVEHFESCPACQESLADIAALKETLARAWSSERARQELRERVCAAVSAVEAGEANSLLEGGPQPCRGPAHLGRMVAKRSRLLVPVAMAAAAVAVAALVWHQGQGGRDTQRVTVIPYGSVTDIVGRHLRCVRFRGLAHHDISLSRDLSLMAERLSSRLGRAVIVPDLSSRGFELVGADLCGFGRMPGAHVLYRTPSTGTMLSVFTIERLGGLGGSAGDPTSSGRVYFSATGDGFTVVLWHQGPQTHVVCAELPRDRVIALAQAIPAV